MNKKDIVIFLFLAFIPQQLPAKYKVYYRPQRPVVALGGDTNAKKNLTFSAPAPEIKRREASAVTYTLSGGRFGDNLLAYLHAKYIAHLYGMPLLYVPFPYSDQLMLHELELPLTSNSSTEFEHHVTLKQGELLDFQPNSSTLYTIPYFPECRQEYEHRNDYPYFEVDWDDQEFFKLICNLIKPRFFIKTLELPKDKITVAVHIRKRTPEFDGPVLFEQGSPTSWEGYADRWAPFKFATDEYYQEQIKRVSAFFNNQPLYVYLFTDSPNPVDLVVTYEKAIQLPNIEFDCRKTGNNHYTNVLEDFFSLTQFDCLIRVDSNFSLTASKLAKYKMMATPKHYYFHATKGYPVIDHVTFTLTKPRS